jgi:hypothetical protein
LIDQLEQEEHVINLSVVRGASIKPPGDVLVMVELGRDQPIEEMAQRRERVAISICFCSVYDDCWVAEMARTPTPVRACPSDEDRRFRN